MPPSPRHVPVYRAERSVSGAKDISTFRERDTYVIIGRGFAAVANHLTLRASKNPEVRARVDRCRFVIIGGDEPWQARGATPLGQFPHMLRLPAHQALGGGRAYAQSDAFGGYIRDAEKGLSRFCAQDVQLGTTSWVGLIETYENRNEPVPDDEGKRRKSDQITASGPQADDWEKHPGLPYRLSVYWRESPTGPLNRSYLYAHYVDVCTGPGPVRLLDPAVWGTPELQSELDGQPYDPPDYVRDKPNEFKRLIKGEHHIGANLPTEPEKKRILIYGASPSSAWSAEHVLKKGAVAELYWVADPARAPDEAKGKSYSDMLKIYFYHPTKANAPGGRNLETLDATSRRHFLGVIDKIEEGPDKALNVTFTVPADAPKDWKNKKVHTFDQVVISIGQNNDKTRPGSASYLIKALGKMNPIYADQLWKGLAGPDRKIPIGTIDRRGGVRVLGAAGVAGPGLSTEATDFRTAYEDYSAVLPPEGRAAGNSLLIAALTIELANRHMPVLLDSNRACLSLIQRATSSEAVAKKVIDARKMDSIRNKKDEAQADFPGKGFMTMDEIISATGDAGSSGVFLSPN